MNPNTYFKQWLRNNKLTKEEAVEILGLSEATIRKYDSKNFKFPSSAKKIMELIDENRILREKVSTLSIKIAELT